MIVLSDEYDDDYNEFLERIKKYLNIDSDNFDVDFLFMPEQNFDPSMNLKDNNVKAFKVTYHFEPGMDKPEVRIEGNFDKKKLQDYFKRFNISNLPQFKQVGQSGQSGKKQAIDVGTLSLEPNLKHKKPIVKEPYHEVNIHDDFADILIEAPGIEKGHIILSLSEDGRNLKVSIEINFIDIEKEIRLPFESTMDNHKLEVNNGIVSIIMRKKNS